MATVNIYDMADTWNDGGTTFTAIKMDVTDTASASGSLLMDLQVGGASKLSVRKDGYLVSAVPGFNFGGKLGYGQAANEGSWLQASSDQGYTWSSTTAPGTGVDLFLSRKGRANIRFGLPDSGASATVTITSANPAVVTFVNHRLSTGSPVKFTTTGTLPTNIVAGTIYYVIYVNSSTFQLATSFANALSGTAIDTSGGSPSGTHTGYRGAAVQRLSVQGSSTLADLPGADMVIQGSQSTGSAAGGSILFQVSPAGSAGSGQNGFETILQITGSGGITGQDGTTANTLALRNGANAQEFRVYKTTTGTVYKALLGDNNLIKISGEAFTDGAGANAATLTNAPAAGNPTKWIPIDDNGTTRYIPAW